MERAGTHNLQTHARPMNYPESTEILKRINSANNILLNCHHHPDEDSVGSALAMYEFLVSKSKEVKIICPSKLPEALKFLPSSDKVETVDFERFVFAEHDLFITLDSSNWHLVAGSHDMKQPNIPIISIDHHDTNQKYGEINLVNPNSAANAQIIYELFQDWKVELSESTATQLLTGIIGDTGAFRFPDANQKTLLIASGLISKGADKEKIMFNLFQNYPIKQLNYLAEALQALKINEEYKFAWTKITLDTYEKFGRPENGKGIIANNFIQSIKGTDFGFVMLEENPGEITISFRSRTGYDVAHLASRVGGGGHKFASAARIHESSLNEAYEKIINALK